MLSGRILRAVCTLQMMLGSGSSVAVQDPSYPVYVDTSVIMGMTGDYNHEDTNFGNVQYMPCTPENGFFPDISVVSPVLFLSDMQYSFNKQAR